MVGDGEWLSIGEAAVRLGVSVWKMREIADLGYAQLGEVRITVTSRRVPSSTHRRVLGTDVETVRRAMNGTAI